MSVPSAVNMTMSGGGMLMAWMPASGHAWLGSAAAFLGMWLAMITAMMLPAVSPALWRYHEALIDASVMRRGQLTALAGAGYFCFWTLVGMVVFPVGAAWMASRVRLPALAHGSSLAVGALVLLAGALQLTPWKSHRLARCRQPLVRGAAPPGAGAAWRYGLRLGLTCAGCCANLMTISLVLGLMDLRVTAVVAVAIALERLAPEGTRIAQATGVVAIAAGLALIVPAVL